MFHARALFQFCFNFLVSYRIKTKNIHFSMPAEEMIDIFQDDVFI